MLTNAPSGYGNTQGFSAAFPLPDKRYRLPVTECARLLPALSCGRSRPAVLVPHCGLDGI